MVFDVRWLQSCIALKPIGYTIFTSRSPHGACLCQSRALTPVTWISSDGTERKLLFCSRTAGLFSTLSRHWERLVRLCVQSGIWPMNGLDWVLGYYTLILDSWPCFDLLDYSQRNDDFCYYSTFPFLKGQVQMAHDLCGDNWSQP